MPESPPEKPAVHPRWRGEHLLTRCAEVSQCGSSPLARGTRAAHHAWRQRGRFIPAGAGNTALHALHQSVLAVHPRWRGEHCPTPAATGATYGSSPLARGTLSDVTCTRAGPRFIPAGAGNTCAGAHEWRVAAVHPRWRGEHASARSSEKPKSGSSPLARGTLPLCSPARRW